METTGGGFTTEPNRQSSSKVRHVQDRFNTLEKVRKIFITTSEEHHVRVARIWWLSDAGKRSIPRGLPRECASEASSSNTSGLCPEEPLFEIGCVFKREKGDHRIYWRVGLKRPIVLPRDAQLPVFVIQNNLRLLGISREQYLEILERI